ncbi:MAG: glutamine--fructose-6-phosphate transaminase (isomerizing) [Clostridiales bacterium]|nr:glutamine--fructose-6-phosphate transaminase (isomerizing) [Clostridiales bacterium]MDD7386931.1 glutamine--fructose-6-phosphate transaminase (isomerizing) [Bacillota bacterium]MDY6040408.1 glutamine--fructose-6-phosphate transaminase (isomerizing) [Candidatus Faecousia sp.]
MCGIVGYTGAQQASPLLLEGLKKLEYRGYDSAGIAVVKDGKISLSKVTGRIANLSEKTDGGRLLPGCTGIGHTRWATHGAPTDTNAHPHVSNDGRFAVVHNGIIENYLELREELTEKGYRFSSETDTEVIVHLVEMYYAGDFRQAVMKASARLEGSYALGIVCADEPDRILVVREASPLILGVGVGENFFASDVTALVAYTRNAIYLEDGQFAELTPHSIQVFDCTGNPVPKKISRITWDIQAAEKGGYEHFMLKEIMEQPRAVKATMAPRLKDGEIVLDDLQISAADLKKINKIVITACGSAYYAGCAAKYAIEKLCRIPVQTELASELRYADPLIDERTLLIVLSQSGETADTIAAMRECQRRGARALAIVNVVGSTIAKGADWCLYTWAGPEIAVATTKGYTTQLTVLFLFAIFTARKLGNLDETEYARLLGELKGLPKLLQQALDMNPGLPNLAKKYHNNHSMFFIGRNTDYAVALEGALKMKEISYIHAESYAAGELKHGTIALIHEGQPVIALCCNEAITEKTMSNIVEVKARGAEVLAVAFRDNQKILSLADDMIYIPRVEQIFSPVVEIVPLQLLAYYVARENGCDIDKPKNLAKSVTVE